MNLEKFIELRSDFMFSFLQVKTPPYAVMNREDYFEFVQKLNQTFPMPLAPGHTFEFEQTKVIFSEGVEKGQILFTPNNP